MGLVCWRKWDIPSVKWAHPRRIENGNIVLIQWIYSGDMDSTVPITGTKKWLHLFKNEHQIPIKRNWREWWVPGKHKGEDQVGGFIW